MRCFLGIVLSVLAAGCATPPSMAGWFAAARPMHVDRASEFPGAESILQGFDAPGSEDRLALGDRVLYGIAIRTGSRIERRLVLFEVEDEFILGQPAGVPFIARQRALVVPEGSHDDTKGVEIDFTSLFVRLRAAVFDGNGKPMTEDAVAVSQRLLAEGIHRGAQPGAETADVGLSIFACLEFMKLIQNTDSLRAILERAVALNIWSVVLNLGVKVSLNIHISETEALGDRIRLPVTIRINDEPALDCSLLVGPSRSPLNIGAGVLSVVGIRPGERDATVTMQVLAARRGS